MQNNNLQNSHNNPELPVPSASTPAASVPSTELAKKLLPPSVRDRKFRALSFGSKLNPVQLSTLAVWLSKDSIERVRQKVAAPPPQGFGMQVCGTTLRRIKKLVDNSVCTTTWVSDAMDTACDLLDAEDAAEVTPLREALGLLLYSRAVRFAEEQAPVEQIDKLLSAITKLEKLKAAATSAPRTLYLRFFTI